MFWAIFDRATMKISLYWINCHVESDGAICFCLAPPKSWFSWILIDFFDVFYNFSFFPVFEKYWFSFFCDVVGLKTLLPRPPPPLRRLLPPSQTPPLRRWLLWRCNILSVPCTTPKNAQAICEHDFSTSFAGSLSSGAIYGAGLSFAWRRSCRRRRGADAGASAGNAQAICEHNFRLSFANITSARLLQVAAAVVLYMVLGSTSYFVTLHECRAVIVASSSLRGGRCHRRSRHRVVVVVVVVVVFVVIVASSSSSSSSSSS